MADNPKVVPIWMGTVEDAVAKFKDRSAEEQEVICQGLAEKYKNEEVGAKARELFKAARPKPAEAKKAEDRVVRLVRRPDGEWVGVWESAEPKPQPEEPTPEDEPKKAAVEDAVDGAVEVEGRKADVRLNLSAPYDIARTF